MCAPMAKSTPKNGDTGGDLYCEHGGGGCENHLAEETEFWSSMSDDTPVSALKLFSSK